MSITEARLQAMMRDLKWCAFQGCRNLVVQQCGGPNTRARLIAALPKYWPDEEYSPVIWPADDADAGRMAIRLIRLHVRFARGDWPPDYSQGWTSPRIRRLMPLADAICLIAHGEGRDPDLRLRNVIPRKMS